MRTLCIMLLLALALQGCGRKGPLILSPAPAAVPHASQSSPETEKTENPKQP